MLKFIARSLWLGWCWFELTILTLFMYLLSWLPRRFTGRYYHIFSCIWCDFLVRALGVDLRLHEKNLNPLPEQYILIANHPSALEDFGIPALFDVYPLAKEGVRHWYFIGRISEAAGTVYVKRRDRESRHAAVDQLIESLEQGKSISIFPEGGCMGKRIHSTFQYGAFDLSLRTGIPVLPVFLHYEAQHTFEWRDPHTLLHKLWHFMKSQNNRANYYVYDPLYPKDFEDKQTYAEHARQLYLKWQAHYLE